MRIRLAEKMVTISYASDSSTLANGLCSIF